VITPEVITLIVAATGGLGTGAAIGIGVLRFVGRDWAEWRKRVEDKIDRLQPEHILKIEGFDPERLDEHYQRLHKLTNDISVVKMTADRAEIQVADHEHRLRVVERKG
jgi:hypothetical protein